MLSNVAISPNVRPPSILRAMISRCSGGKLRKAFSSSKASSCWDRGAFQLRLRGLPHQTRFLRPTRRRCAPPHAAARTAYRQRMSAMPLKLLRRRIRLRKTLCTASSASVPEPRRACPTRNSIDPYSSRMRRIADLRRPSPARPSARTSSMPHSLIQERAGGEICLSYSMGRRHGRAWEILGCFGPTHRRVPQPGCRNRHGAPQTGSCPTAKDDSGKSGVRFLADRNEEQDSGLRRSLVERDKEEDGFVRFGWEETKEGGCRWHSPDDRNWLSFHDRYHAPNYLLDRSTLTVIL